jgi:hypothetical protein
MKYFALIAKKGDRRERPCALIDASTIEDAAVRARRLRDEGFLSYVEAGSTYSIRAASRWETQLLQRFLNACNRADDKIHMQSDFDGLLARRQSLLLSFFMGLYLAPDRVRQVADGSQSQATPPSAPKPTGSGGVEQEGQSAADALDASPVDHSASPSPQSSSAVTETDAAEDVSTGPIDNSSQHDALAAILDTTNNTDTQDRSVDLGDGLGDDEIF